MNKALKDAIDERGGKVKKFATEACPILAALIPSTVDEATRAIMVDHALVMLIKGPLKNYYMDKEY